MAEPNPKKKKLDQRSPQSNCENINNERDTVIRNFPRFLVIENKEASEKTLASLSPFVIERAMRGISESVQNVKKLRSGSLLVEVSREAQANNLLKITEFASVPVVVSPHRTLNITKGVIRSRELSRLTAEELLPELQNQGVTAIHNIYQTRDGQKQKTATIILTFTLAKLPEKIRAGYEVINVEPYIPNPLRCFKCQLYGHGQSTCSKQPICAKCGLAAHGETPCSRTPHCVNCNGDHPAYVPVCPVWQREKEVCRVKTIQEVSFAEAKKIVTASHQLPPTGIKYSSAVAGKKTMVTVGTQTDIVDCKCQPNVEASVKTKSTGTLTVQQDTSSGSNQNTSKQANRNVTSQQRNSKSSNVVRTHSLSPSAGNKRNVTSNKSKSQTDRLPKGSVDPINLYNKYQGLEEMEGDISESEPQTNKPAFKPTQILPPTTTK